MGIRRAAARLAGAVAVGAVMASMLGMSVCAADTIASVPVTKTVKAEENVMAPNTSFTFSIQPGDGATIRQGDKTIPVVGGPADGAAFAEGADTITFGPTVADGALTQDTAITLDVNAFAKPGVYSYKITEEAGSYDGMSYAATEYVMNVWVEQANGEKKITAVTVNDEAVGTGKRGKVEFINTYATNTLTVTKEITGNLANMSQKFNIDVTVNGAEGEQYKAFVGTEEVVLTSGTKATFSLGNNESVVVYGLSAADTFTVEENDAIVATDGYTVTYKLDNKAAETINEVAEGTADKTVVITNDKSATTPTGIILNIAPYVLMIAAAGVLAIVFFRRRRTDI